MTQRFTSPQVRPRAAFAVGMPCLILAYMATVVALNDPTTPFAFLAGIVAGWVGARHGAAVSVVADDHGLTVRTPYRTHRLAWAEIRGFEVEVSSLGSFNGRRGFCPVAVTDTRRVPLLAMPVAPTRLRFASPLNDNADVIERWERTYLRYENASRPR